MKKVLFMLIVSFMFIFSFSISSYAGGSWYTNGQSGTVNDSDIPNVPPPTPVPSTSTDTYHHTPKCVRYKRAHWINEQFQCGSTRKCWDSTGSAAGMRLCEDVPKYCTKKVWVKRECAKWE